MGIVSEGNPIEGDIGASVSTFDLVGSARQLCGPDPNVRCQSSHGSTQTSIVHLDDTDDIGRVDLHLWRTVPPETINTTRRLRG